MPIGRGQVYVHLAINSPTLCALANKAQVELSQNNIDILTALSLCVRRKIPNMFNVFVLDGWMDGWMTFI